MSESERTVHTYKAGADLSTSDGLVVKRSTVAGEVIAVSAATDRPAGVIDASGGNTSGQSVRVVTSGRCKVKAGGAISVHTRVAGSTGAKVAEAASTNYVLGEIEEAAGADGDLVTIFVRISEVPLA